jgi:ribonuclease D
MASLASSQEIAEAAQIAAERGRLGIDTEFMSEGRYRALLCLVQIAVDDPDAPNDTRVLMIDTLDHVQSGPIAEVLADPAVEIVLHAGRQDVAILRRVWRTEVTNIFDTQIAAGFAGLGAQTGYGNLLGAVLGRRVGKTASYTRWDVRPLTEEQLSYAAEDVVHLLELADEIRRRLERSGRVGWAQEECRRLEGTTDERDPLSAWERLPRVGQLDPRSRAVARELAAWRERTAAKEDKPVNSIVGDPSLVELAKRQPGSMQALEQIRGLHASTVRRRGSAVLDAIVAGKQAPPIPREEGRARSEAADVPLIVLAEALLRARAMEVDLAYELVASRNELEAIVGAARRGEPHPPVRALTGWRGELLGADLRDLLAGRSALSVGPERRLRLEPLNGQPPA